MYLKKLVLGFLVFTLSLILVNSLQAGDLAFESSNLPIVVIDTHGKAIPDDYRIVADMGIIYNGPGQRNYLHQPFNHFQGKIAIELRGSSSQMFPKKQYALETQTETGENLNVSLLGLPKENDWILNGPYSDKTLIRNVLIYQLSREIGQYASRTRFCELILNGDYRGVYILMEKIKRDKHRVNISKLNPDEIAGDDLTGGYIIKIDKTAGEEVDGWQSIFPPYPGALSRIYYQYHYPKPDEIVSQQKAYIQKWIFNFEKKLFANTFMDPDSGYYPLIDLKSFIDFFILNEISKNVDGYRLSSFMYKDRDSKDPKMHMGPIWDFNLGFGNANYYHGYQTSGWQVFINYDSQFRDWNDPFMVPFWWEKMMSDSVFVKQIIQRYSELRQSTLSLDHVWGLIDSYVDTLSEAQQRNFERWPVLNQYVWPNYYIGQTWQDEINWMKNWIKERLQWMDSQLFDQVPPQAPSRVTVVDVDHSSVSLSWSVASDNVGVAGYDLYLNGQYVLSTRNNGATIGDLLDDQSFEVMVKTRDFAGNRSVNNPQISFRTKPFTTKDGLVCLKTTTPIIIDGLEDAMWDQYAWQTAEKILMGSIDNEQDLSVKFKLAWDENAIYLLTRIIDDAKVRDSGDNLFLDDDLEVYFDMDNSKSSYYDLGDFHYRFTFQDSQIVETQFNAVKGITFAPRLMEDGYQAEIAFPWSALNSRAKNGKLIGFDLQVNDDDDGGIRDGKLGWWANSDNARPSLFGQVKMRLFPTYLETSVPLPDNFMLLNAYPNPFNGQVTIKLELASTATVQLDLFDLNGRRLNTIYQGKLAAGASQFQLDLADKASGLYFVRLVNAHTGQSQTLKVVLIK